MAGVDAVILGANGELSVVVRTDRFEAALRTHKAGLR